MVPLVKQRVEHVQEVIQIIAAPTHDDMKLNTKEHHLHFVQVMLWFKPADKAC